MNLYLEVILDKMIKTCCQLASLTKLILRQGRLRKKGYDFQKNRSENLLGLPAFCPVTPLSGIGKIKKGIQGISYLGYLSGNVSWLTKGLSIKGGHLFAPAYNLAYVRNPKAGSTSLCSVMLMALYPELIKFHPSTEKINYLADVNLKSKISPAEQQAVFFTMVRNPFARIVSVFREFFEKCSSTFLYDDYLFGIFKKEFSFLEFIDILEAIPECLLDQHLKPQSDFLKYYKKRNMAVTHFKLEDQPAIQKFLSEFKLTMPVLNQQEIAYDYRTYYNQFTLEKVHRLYFNDIALFGYSQDYQALKEFVEARDEAPEI